MVELVVIRVEGRERVEIILFAGVFAPSARARAMALLPFVRLAGVGGAQIWFQMLMAMPQYAMAQSGLASVIAVNSFKACPYQNECRAASAASKRG
jgi:hypothetical protein